MSKVKESPLLRFFLYPIIMARRMIRAWLFRRRVAKFRNLLTQLSSLPRAVFVKVGANDGVTGDPCSDILLGHPAWMGLLIEPVPYCIDRLKKNFADPERFTIMQSAIAASTGVVTFYHVDRDAITHLPTLPSWYDQVGSFDRNHILTYLGSKIEPYIIESKIPACTLVDALRTNNINDIHLLHVDTEGYDYEVIKQLNFSIYKPVIIYVEHKHLSDDDRSAMFRLLRDNGYMTRDCGIDFFAYNKDAHRRLSMPDAQA